MDNGTELFDPTRGVHVLRVDNPRQLEAEVRAKSLIEQAQLNEAIRVITELMAEVDSMPISARFRRDKKPSESPHVYLAGLMNPNLKDLNEVEYKRYTLHRALEVLAQNILLNIGQLEAIVMDVEATKTDWTG